MFDADRNFWVCADGTKTLSNYRRDDMPTNFRLFKASRGEPLDASPPPPTLPPPPSGVDAGELPTGMLVGARCAEAWWWSNTFDESMVRYGLENKADESWSNRG